MMNRERIIRKTENRVRKAVILVVLAVVCSGSYVYAKYFSEASRYGVAIASGVYFSANYAAESEDFFECNVSYSGGNDEISFEVRNYENNLLFNESSVSIPYSVSFWLGKAPSDDIKYTVKTEGADGIGQEIPVGETNTVEIDETKVITFNNQSIAGGAARANEYVISISGVESGTTHEPVPIYVLVETSESASIDKTLRGKMVLGESDASKLYIEQGFVVPDGDADEFERIQRVSMFTYEIKMVGEAAKGDVTEKLKVSWNPNLLEIDLFDEAYLAWIDSETSTDGTVKPVGPKEETVDGVKWCYFTLDIVPYSAQSVGFFRGDSFATKVGDMDELNAAVQVAIIVENVE